METTLLNLIKFLEIDKNITNDFYHISFFENDIKLQGYFTNKIAKKYSLLDFQFTAVLNLSFKEHIIGKNCKFPNITIILTK